MSIKKWKQSAHATPFSLEVVNNSIIFFDMNCEKMGILK